jgi:hypothetical protein
MVMRRLKRMCLFVTVAGLVAAGCGGGDDAVSTPTVTFTPSSTEPSATSSPGHLHLDGIGAQYVRDRARVDQHYDGSADHDLAYDGVVDVAAEPGAA